MLYSLSMRKMASVLFTHETPITNVKSILRAGLEEPFGYAGHKDVAEFVNKDVAALIHITIPTEFEEFLVPGMVESDPDEKCFSADIPPEWIDRVIEAKTGTVLYEKGRGIVASKLNMRKKGKGLSMRKLGVKTYPYFGSQAYVTKQELRKLYKQEAEGIYDEELMDEIISGFLATLSEMLLYIQEHYSKDYYSRKVAQLQPLITILENSYNSISQEKMIVIDRMVHYLHDFGFFVCYLIVDGDETFLNELGYLKVGSLNIRKKAYIVYDDKGRKFKVIQND